MIVTVRRFLAPISHMNEALPSDDTLCCTPWDWPNRIVVLQPFDKRRITAAAQSCDSQAVSANGKPLHGAAKMSFVRKCKQDTCGSKAVSADGKPLHGAAKNSFMAKCERGA